MANPESAAPAVKVWGWYGFRGGKQTREVVAARSMAAAARAAGEKDARRLFNLGETGNDEEMAVASTSPGVVFWRGLDDRRGDPWTKGTSHE